MLLAIIRKQLLLIKSEKGVLFRLFLMPAVFITLFAGVFGHTSSNVKLTYLDNDHTTASKQWINAMSKVKNLQLKTETSIPLTEQIESVKSGKLDILLVIPKGFEQQITAGKQADIELYQDVTAGAATAPVHAILQGISSGYRDVKISSTLTELTQSSSQVDRIMASPVKIKEIQANSEKVNPITQFVPGFTIMFLFFIPQTMIQAFFKDKDNGMLSRLSSTPMTPLQYLVGMWIPFILTTIVQAVTLFAFGHFVYNLDLGNPAAIAAIILSLSVSVTGIGLAMTMLIRNETQGMVVGQVIAMGGALLGGLWFPTGLLPGFARIIGYAAPQYWAQHAMLDIMAHKAGLSQVALPALILLAIGTIGLAIAFIRFKSFRLSAVS